MFLNEVFERVESKVMGMEQQLHLLNAEQRRDKENLGRLEVTNHKNKLEIKMTDLVNRLLSEQDERAR
jgi:hypothetical protein